MGDCISILTKESYHYVLNHEMTHVACAFHGTCVWTLDGYMMYKDNDLEKILTPFNYLHLRLN